MSHFGPERAVRRLPLDLLDGHLLRVLCVLLEERSVSRTARRLDQTQPAISAALKRLRATPSANSPRTGST